MARYSIQLDGSVIDSTYGLEKYLLDEGERC